MDASEVLYYGPNNFARDLQEKLKDDVKDFHATGDGVTDDTSAFIELRDYLQTNSEYRGGIFELPKGRFKVTQPLHFTQYAPGQVHNIIIRGQGPIATIIEFSGLTSEEDGISFGAGVHFGIEHLAVTGAGRDGISIVGGSKGSTDFNSQGYLNNVRVQLSGRHGFFSQNTFMLSLDNVWSSTNGAGGFVFNGFHTSVTGRRNWAYNNPNDAGWAFNGMTYSAFDALGSDNNKWGYVFSNINGMTLNGCGAEGSLQDSYFAHTSDAASLGIPSEYQNIKGLVLNGCHALHGSTSQSGMFASFLALKTDNSRPISVSLNGCTSTKTNTNDKAIVAVGSSGKINIHEQACVFDGEVSISGNVVWQGRAFSFLPYIAGSSSTGGCTYQIRRGHFKIDSGICTFDAEIQWSGHTGLGNMEIRGLPYVSTSASNTLINISAGSVMSVGVCGGFIGSGSSKITLTDTPLGGARNYLSMDASGSIMISGSYPI